MTTTHHPVTTSATTFEPTSGAPGNDPSAAGGAFTRLNPVDGLFLRAQHLATMQEFTRDLVSALGAGLGPGVVYGYSVAFTEDGKGLRVQPGLAFAQGKPLCTTSPLNISVQDLNPTGDEFYVVEIVPAEWSYGSEPVYGGLCDDPCSGSGIRPFTADGVRLRVREDRLANLANSGMNRNFLASQYFERERSYGGRSTPSANAPWLLPSRKNANILDLRDRPWSDGTGSYAELAVPLALLWRSEDEDGKKVWQLDTWAARRDLGEPTPAAAWQWRLGWRPRNVFIAQILQFQEQLADFVNSGSATAPLLTVQQSKDYNDVATLATNLKSDLLRNALDATRFVRAHLSNGFIADTGFDELPPAGYLPWQFDSVLEAEMMAPELFGLGVEVRVVPCRADFVAHAVESAQHMDRIPLSPKGSGLPAKVDLLIPIELSDLDATYVETYPWSAFVRRRDTLETNREVAAVYTWRIEGRGVRRKRGFEDAVDAFVKWHQRERKGERPGPGDVEFRGRVTFAAGQWEVPLDAEGDPGDIWRTVHSVLTGDFQAAGVLGVANKADRQPLLAQRALWMAAPANEHVFEPLVVPPVYVRSVEGLRVEAIVVCYSRNTGNRDD